MRVEFPFVPFRPMFSIEKAELFPFFAIRSRAKNDEQELKLYKNINDMDLSDRNFSAALVDLFFKTPPKAGFYSRG